VIQPSEILKIAMPLMLACVSAFYVARGLSPESVYSRQLLGSHALDTPLFLLHVRDLMKVDPICVLETSGFAQIARVLSANTFKHLYVVDPNRRFLGAIALQDLKPFLHDTDLPHVVIAMDLMHDDISVLTSDASLKESLDVFARHDGERLPVLDNSTNRRPDRSFPIGRPFIRRPFSSTSAALSAANPRYNF